MAVFAVPIEAYVRVLLALVNINTGLGVVLRRLEAFPAPECLATTAAVVFELEAWRAEADRIPKRVAIMSAPAVRLCMTWVGGHARPHVVVQVHVLGAFANHLFVVRST